MLHDEANRHSVTTYTDLAEGLPNVMADRVQLHQALMNLMLNGIEAMRDTTGELRLGCCKFRTGATFYFTLSSIVAVTA